MNTAQRIDTKREIATLLSQRDWVDIDLVLSEHGLPTTDDWRGDNLYQYVIAMIREATDPTLLELHAYVTGGVITVKPGAEPWRAGELRLFMSHLATHQKFVSDVGIYVQGYGVSAFVAHVSIDASEEWQTVIETALVTSDAMVVFLHDGFKESNWCDQEVGFAMARRIPVLPLNIDLNPYGFMGKLQAELCAGMAAPQIGDKIVQWLIRTPSAQAAMTDGLVKAFEGVYSYDRAREVYGKLIQLRSYTPAQLQRLDAATRNNDQVKDANLSGTSIPELVQVLIRECGGIPVVRSEPDPWASSEPPF
ncbi:toll/interleukin-1 receptor domain-containing protein [Jatrophihabitans lederbergiae]|uniref:Toll/interleukin-1 receptor domain-containing protein n=1 Tax=Jatrophihabitans lederbergiae TaxID=3075547 RepID=A0ABU2JE31_9ACTN|nr:toll/interleukin-1 receptor domain-containing protein [Jatrophihabitans sp. DSM 44399]MDT0263197.1 toll/interleukin-1 receptor domain-containing protein [Jatrophihabitans sp. DSM 44399]